MKYSSGRLEIENATEDFKNPYHKKELVERLYVPQFLKSFPKIHYSISSGLFG